MAAPPQSQSAFREVTVPDTGVSSGRALEQIHKTLQAQVKGQLGIRNATVTTMGQAPQSLMLLGIMSGNPARRRLLRCMWSRAIEVHGTVRVLFVVGSSTPLSTEWELSAQEMELRVNISEGVRVWRPPERPGASRRHQSLTGTFSTYFKQATFLRFAASQPEPLVGRADDDAFISPHMLLAYANILSTLPHPFYAGVFEWISWRAAMLEATGFSYGLSEARGRAKAPHRNCSRTVPDELSTAYDHKCVGPFACAHAIQDTLRRRAVRASLQSPARFAPLAPLAHEMLPTP